jgi:molybdate transport system substrate-binding protein
MPAAPGAAAEIRVLSAGAMAEIVEELGRPFERASGVKIVAEFTRSPLVRDRIRAGAVFDVVLTTRSRIDELARESKVSADSAMTLARSGIGVAVRAGQGKPDIGTVEAFIAALRGARSIACADPAFGTASGLYLQELFERLGLAAELKSKLRLVGTVGGKPVVVCAAVADGSAELGIQQIAEIVAVPGVELVGPLPAEIQHITEFAAVVASSAENAGAARAFVKFLASDEAKGVIAAHGMQPA